MIQIFNINQSHEQFVLYDTFNIFTFVLYFFYLSLHQFLFQVCNTFFVVMRYIHHYVIYNELASRKRLHSHVKQKRIVANKTLSTFTTLMSKPLTIVHLPNDEIPLKAIYLMKLQNDNGSYKEHSTMFMYNRFANQDIHIGVQNSYIIDYNVP